MRRILHHVPVRDASGVKHSLSARKVMTSRQDLGPTVEGPAGRKAVELEVLAGLGHVPIAMTIGLVTLAAIVAHRGLVCVRGHADENLES